MSDSQREQSLNTSMDRSQIQRLEGRIDQRLTDLFDHREAEVERDRNRFDRAIEEGWELHYAVATSGAHGWQIESDHGLQLAEGAYPEDVSWLVFQNGWIQSMGARWLKDDDLTEWVADVQKRRETATERVSDAERGAFEADDRLRYAEDVVGNEMSSWWVFNPTGFVGQPEAVVAHAAGFDARGEDGDFDE